MPCAYVSLQGKGCQFEAISDAEMLDQSGMRFCVFHAPMTAVDSDGVAKKDWNENRVDDCNRRILAMAKEGRANFTGVLFPRDFPFDDAKFASRASFNGATFSGEASFDGARFSEDASFDGAKFSREAGFDRATFSGIASFTDATFSGGAWFAGAAFSRDALFAGARFSEDALFAGATFSREARFDRATFSGSARFDRGTFSDSARFAGARFSDSARFNGATFSGDVLFAGATFSSVALFAGATFSDGAWFDRATFSGHAIFSASSDAPEFIGAMGFLECNFLREAVFTNRQFRKPSDFSNAVFARAPIFHGATLHQGTDFTEAKFLDRRGDAAPAYRTLKLAMAGMRARDEEGLFAALEQECRRQRPDTPRLVKLFSLVYGWTSRYGLSVSRPILWLFALTSLFAIVYLAGFVETPSWPLPYSPEQVGETARFTATQLFRPFDAFGAGRPDLYKCAGALAKPSLSLALLAAVQSVASLTLVALFLLALRWRFKRD